MLENGEQISNSILHIIVDVHSVLHEYKILLKVTGRKQQSPRLCKRRNSDIKGYEEKS